jgi:hypothetical protein
MATGTDTSAQNMAATFESINACRFPARPISTARVLPARSTPQAHLTAALMLGGIVTSTTAAAVTATLDTGTLMETASHCAFPSLAVSDYFEFSVIATGANGFTIATATGWTDGGNAFVAVATGTSARFGVRRTAANTYTIFKSHDRLD